MPIGPNKRWSDLEICGACGIEHLPGDCIPPRLIAAAPDLLRALAPFAEAFRRVTNPGDSDLYDEQPYHLTVTLGDCRKALSAMYAAREAK